MESAADDRIPHRLRAERKRLGLTQKAFADVGGVGLGAQHRYESGASLPDIEYLFRVEKAGVDWRWVLTGQRDQKTLGKRSSELIDAFEDLAHLDQLTILQLTYSLAGRPLPEQPKLAGAELEEALFHFLRVSPTEDLDELARELAASLPTILQASEGAYSSPQTDPSGFVDEPQAGDDADRREARRAKRS